MVDWRQVALQLAPWAVPLIFGGFVYLLRKVLQLAALPAAVAAVSRRNRLTLDAVRRYSRLIENLPAVDKKELLEVRDKVDDLRDELCEMEGHEPMRPNRTLAIDAGPLREILRKGKK